MKRLRTILVSFLASLSLIVGVAGVASAAPVVTGAPAECTGTYTKKVVISQYGSYYAGTAANELIVVNAGGGYIGGASGNDCIVLSASANGSYVTAGLGADVIVSNSSRNALNGDGGADEIYAYGGQDGLNGGTGSDYCEYNYATSGAKSCEL